ncbi:hypothetical protein HK099_002193 [Clydaea vesicula]|uniref:Uncharacterized protein n=1 Tax=Clydaea vesicula TaxID=447962 RepID=A0AAD5TVL2_9FUNG|nr:hypothetical protein HK099_002193 [Clydaea vesicula]
MYTLLENLKLDNLKKETYEELKNKVDLLSLVIDEKGPFVSKAASKVKQVLSKNAVLDKPEIESLIQAERILKFQKIAQEEMRFELFHSPAKEIALNSTFMEEGAFTPTSLQTPMSATTARQQGVVKHSSTSSLDYITGGLRNKNNSQKAELIGFNNSTNDDDVIEEREIDVNESKMLLEHNKILQEELTDELSRLTYKLKSNAENMKNFLEKDKEVQKK